MSEAWLNREINAYKQREKDRKKKKKQYEEDCKKKGVKNCKQYVTNQTINDIWHGKVPGKPGYLDSDPHSSVGGGKSSSGGSFQVLDFVSAYWVWFLIGGAALVVFFLLR